MHYHKRTLRFLLVIIKCTLLISFRVGIVVTICKEHDVDWIHNDVVYTLIRAGNSVELTVFCKCGNHSIIGQKCILLQNVGREAHTHFLFMIRNYNLLPDQILFLNGGKPDLGSVSKIVTCFFSTQNMFNQLRMTVLFQKSHFHIHIHTVFTYFPTCCPRSQRDS